ncbi:MAG: nucleotidyltransferase domain-containing protein [Oscillospiraceae bacterium]|nr:nucleotidyltransferase domain-containing protein [Oscillospiraceae bacterium]
MTTDPQALKDIAEITELIKQAVPAERIYLFGSYAYGTPTEDSDYDFFVVIPDGSMRALDAAFAARQTFSKLGSRRKPIDVLTDYASKFDARSKLPTIERKIHNEGVMLYDRSRLGT